MTSRGNSLLGNAYWPVSAVAIAAAAVAQPIAAVNFRYYLFTIVCPGTCFGQQLRGTLGLHNVGLVKPQHNNVTRQQEQLTDVCCALYF